MKHTKEVRTRSGKGLAVREPAATMAEREPAVVMAKLLRLRVWPSSPTLVSWLAKSVRMRVRVRFNLGVRRVVDEEGEVCYFRTRMEEK